MNPAGSRLYVTQDTPGAMNARLDVLDPTTGHPVRPPIRLTGGTGYNGLAASDGGVWIETGTGMTDELDFRPATDLTRSVGPLTSAGGGMVDQHHVYRHVVWISGITKLACADPRTGAIRASARVPAPHGDAALLSSITTAGNGLFAHFDAEPARATCSSGCPPG